MGHGRDAVGGSGVRAALQLMLCIPPHHSNPPPLPSQAPHLLHPQVLLLRPSGGGVSVPEGGSAHLQTEAGC